MPLPRTDRWLLATLLATLALPVSGAGIELTEGRITGSLVGTHEVFENRESREGRRIPLHVVVLRATGEDPRPDPIFFLVGGPGQAATDVAPMLARSWMRDDRDIVLVDQRGTGKSNGLQCELPGGPDDPQGYLEPFFAEEPFRRCLKQLQQRADLRLYTTPIAMDDLDEVRAALGYERINVIGGSYGTRAALIYLRRHPQSVRTAVLQGVAPVTMRNPLTHARLAQEALERTFANCERDAACRAAFPRLRREFRVVLKRLRRAPATVVERRAGKPDRTFRLDHEAFAETLRGLMYYSLTGPNVPRAIHSAYEGDYLPLVQAGLMRGYALRESLSFGMLLSVTCAEDLAQISPRDIARETRGTFLGDGRVRRQSAVCEFWPRGDVPQTYWEPVRSEAPTLLFSGTLDPVTSVAFGEETVRHLPNGLHLAVPGYHDVDGPCVHSIHRQFLDSGTVRDLDTSCIAEMKLPPFTGTAGP